MAITTSDAVHVRNVTADEAVNLTKIAQPMTTNTVVDSNGNQVNSGSKFTGSTSGAVNHNYAGGGTPTFVDVVLTVAGTVTATAIGATQATITLGTAGAYVGYAQLI